MYSFKNILVALDNTDIDEELIYAASYAALAAQSTDIHFVHVIKDVSVPAAVRKEFPNLLKDAIDDRKKEIQRKIDQYFSYEGGKIHVQISTGAPTKCILKYSAQKKSDLIIMGRKNEKPDGGIITNRIARRAACSLLIFPKGFKRKINKIMIPIDFSDNSFDALSTAIEVVGKNAPYIELVAQNVYQVPTGYHYTGKSYNEFAGILKENLEADYKKWKKKLPKSEVSVKTLFSLDRHDDVTAAIYTTALEEQADAIVISVKGLTSTTALFLGSKAETIVQHNSILPLLVLREGKQEGILDYLKNL